MDTFRIALIFLLLLVGHMAIKAQDASVHLVTPESVIAGEEFLIEVMIVKGNNSSFAKLQLDIPPAFKIDSSKSDSARFSFSDSQAKYIWDRMPAKDTLKVDFKATTDPAFSGARGVNGVFAYIVNKKKEEVRIPTKAIKVQPPVLASAPVEIAENFAGEESRETKTEEEKKAEAILAREAKIKEEKKAEAEALYAAQKAMMEEEKKADIEAAAIIAAREAKMAEEKKADVEAAAIIAAREAKMAEEKKANIEAAAILAAREAKMAEEKKAEQAAIAAAQKDKEEKKSKEPTSVISKTSTSSVPKIEFRVQIVASAIKVDMGKLKARYAITEKIQEEFHKGLWKYTTGSHASYGTAKSKIPVYRNEKGVEGAFLTAYKNGQRIAVKDAINQTK